MTIEFIRCKGNEMQPLYKSCYPLDNRCYEEYNLTEDILMEHAANGMAKYIRDNFEKKSSVLVVCGVGNNGADGLVLARQLQSDYDVKIYLPFGVRSEMAEMQLERTEYLDLEFLVNTIEEYKLSVDDILDSHEELF